MSALATTPDDLKHMIQQIIDDERDSLTTIQICRVLIELAGTTALEDKP